MAVTKRRKSTSRRTPARRKTMSAAPRRKRRRTKPKGFLSDFMNPAEAKAGFQSTTSGGVGGALMYLYNHFVQDNAWSSEVKNGIAVLGAFGLATIGKKPNTGAGMAGAAIFNYMLEQGFLASGSSQVNRVRYADPLQNLPTALSEGDMMQLQDNMYLADNGGAYDVGYYPNGFGGVS